MVPIFVGYFLVCTAFFLTMVTIDGLQRYPKMSYGRTAIFIFTLFALLVFVILKMVRVEISWIGVGVSFFGVVLLLIVWAFVVQFVRKKTLIVIPGGIIDKLLQRLDERFELIHINKPDPRTLEDRDVDALVLDTKQSLSSEWVGFVTEAQLQGMSVFSAHELIEKYSGRLVLSHLDETTATQFAPGATYRIIKRILDIFIVIVTLPLMLVTVLLLSILIRIESPGAVIFKQARIGERGKQFTVYKFRSMLRDAESAGPAFAYEDDARITGIGKFIRQYRIDELPQFLNILRGEMSLIGPRPEQVKMANQFRDSIPYYSYRHMVKPGITGWAQVTHGYTADMSQTEVKLEHDLYYIKHYSAWLDLLIGIKTIRTILTGFGAR